MKLSQFFFSVITLQRDNIEIKPGEEIIVLKNVHKTYLLGVEGVPALRWDNNFFETREITYIRNLGKQINT